MKTLIAIIASFVSLSTSVKADTGKETFKALDGCQRTYIQQLLSDKGLYSSGIDGLWGKGTAKALAQYSKGQSTEKVLKELSEGKDCNKNIESASEKSAVKTCLEVKLEASVDGNDVSNSVNAMVAYEKGRELYTGVSKNGEQKEIYKKRAYNCFQFAQENGEVNSNVFLGLMHLDGEAGLKKNVHQALDYFFVGAKNGVTSSFINIAEIYRNGNKQGNIQSNKMLAIKWYILAVHYGFDVRSVWPMLRQVWNGDKNDKDYVRALAEASVCLDQDFVNCEYKK